MFISIVTTIAVSTYWNKYQRIPKGQSKMVNQEKLAI